MISETAESAAGWFGQSDALVVVAVLTFIVGPIVTAVVANGRSRRRSRQLEADFGKMRDENTAQHSTGQQVLQSLVDSHHLVVHRLDLIHQDIADLKRSAHTHHPAEVTE